MDRKTHRTSPCPAEFRRRAAQKVADHLDGYRSLTAAVRGIAHKLGCCPDGLRVCSRQARRDAGREAGSTSAQKARIREPERELRQANEILKTAGAYCAPLPATAGLRLPAAGRSSTVRSANDRRHPLPGRRCIASPRGDGFREEFGVEPIRRALPIAPSTCHARKAVERDPSRATARARRDDELRERIGKVWSDDRGLYGARKVRHALRRDGIDVARGAVERLMRGMGLQGAARGGKVATTTPDAGRARAALQASAGGCRPR